MRSYIDDGSVSSLASKAKRSTSSYQQDISQSSFSAVNHSSGLQPSLTVPLLPKANYVPRAPHEAVHVDSNKPISSDVPEKAATDGQVHTGKLKGGNINAQSGLEGENERNKTSQNKSGSGKNVTHTKSKSEPKQEVKAVSDEKQSAQHVPNDENSATTAAQLQQEKTANGPNLPGITNNQTALARKTLGSLGGVQLDPLRRRFILRRNHEQSSPNITTHTSSATPSNNISMGQGDTYIDIRNRRFIRSKQRKNTTENMPQQPQFVQWAGQAVTSPPWDWYTPPQHHAPPQLAVLEPPRAPIPASPYPFFPPWYASVPPGVFAPPVVSNQVLDVGNSKTSSRTRRTSPKAASFNVPPPPPPPPPLLLPVVTATAKTHKLDAELPKKIYKTGKLAPTQGDKIVVPKAVDSGKRTSLLDAVVDRPVHESSKTSNVKSQASRATTATIQSNQRAELSQTVVPLPNAALRADVELKLPATTSKASKKYVKSTGPSAAQKPSRHADKVEVYVEFSPKSQSKRPIKVTATLDEHNNTASVSPRRGSTAVSAPSRVPTVNVSDTSRYNGESTIRTEVSQVGSTKRKVVRDASNVSDVSKVCISAEEQSDHGWPADSEDLQDASPKIVAPAGIPVRVPVVEDITVSPKSSRSRKAALLPVDVSIRERIAVEPAAESNSLCHRSRNPEALKATSQHSSAARQSSVASQSRASSTISHASHFKQQNSKSRANKPTPPAEPPVSEFFETPKRSPAWHAMPNQPELWISRPEPPDDTWNPPLPSVHPRDSVSQISSRRTPPLSSKKSSRSGQAPSAVADGGRGREMVVVVGGNSPGTRRSSNYRAPTVQSVQSSSLSRGGGRREEAEAESEAQAQAERGVRVRIRRTRTRTMGWERSTEVEDEVEERGW